MASTRPAACIFAARTFVSMSCRRTSFVMSIAYWSIMCSSCAISRLLSWQAETARDAGRRRARSACTFACSSAFAFAIALSRSSASRFSCCRISWFFIAWRWRLASERLIGAFCGSGAVRGRLYSKAVPSPKRSSVERENMVLRASVLLDGPRSVSRRARECLRRRCDLYTFVHQLARTHTLSTHNTHT